MVSRVVVSKLNVYRTTLEFRIGNVVDRPCIVAESGSAYFSATRQQFVLISSISQCTLLKKPPGISECDVGFTVAEARPVSRGLQGVCASSIASHAAAGCQCGGHAPAQDGVPAATDGAAAGRMRTAASPVPQTCTCPGPSRSRSAC